MKNLFKITFLSLSILTSLVFVGCSEDGIDGINGVDGVDGTNGKDGIDGQDYTPTTLDPLTASVVPNTVFKLIDPSVKVDMIMTSQDILPSDSTFVYGSYTDGCALFDNGDDTYSFIVNLERDFSIARIKMNKELQPLEGDYIVNSNATAFTAMCSGSGITKKEHGFGPMYLSGGEWVGQGAGAQGIYVVDPYKDAGLASFATRSAAMGE